MPNRRRRRRQPWETWPVVIGADTADVVPQDLFRQFLKAATEIAETEPDKDSVLTDEDLAFCRRVAKLARAATLNRT
jgi:hypothetical protein